MLRAVVPLLLAALASPALAAAIDFGGFAFDRQPYDAFSRATGMTCRPSSASITCTGSIVIEGARAPGVAVWRRTRKSEWVLAQGSADLACDTASTQRFLGAATARWGKPETHALASRKSIWTWRDAAGNRATFSDAPEAGRATCPLLVEDGRWGRE